MLRYIEKLRAKPESIRKTTALIISLGIIIAVFIAWLSGLPSNLSSTDENTDNQSSSSPFELVKEGAGSVYNDFGNVVDNAKNVWPF